MHPSPFVWDTSALLNWDNWYPGELMPNMWAHLDRYVAAERLVIPAAVVAELGSTSDSLARWIKAVPSALIWSPATDYLKLVHRIQRDFPALAPKRSRPQVADAYVVAAGFAMSGTVVSDELSNSTDLGPGPPYSKQKRMDAACRALDVTFCSSRTFMHRCLNDLR